MISGKIVRLIFLSMLISTCINFSIIAFPKIFSFWGFETTCGSLFFPIGYALSDYIGFEHGRKTAFIVYIFAIFLDILFSVFGIILYYIPSSPEFTQNHIYHPIFIQSGLVLSLFAALGVFISQQLNLSLFFSRRLKYFIFPVRSSLSSLPADIFVACFVFIPKAYHSGLSGHLAMLITNSALTKCAISIIFAFILYIFIRPSGRY